MKREAEVATKRVRRRYTAEFRRQVVEQTMAPGASVAAIALEHRLNANLLFTWRSRHLRTIGAVAAAAKMLPVMVEPTPTLDGKSLPRVAAGVIEIELAAGRIRLKGAVDVETLRAVIGLLARR